MIRISSIREQEIGAYVRRRDEDEGEWEEKDPFEHDGEKEEEGDEGNGLEAAGEPPRRRARRGHPRAVRSDDQLSPRHAFRPAGHSRGVAPGRVLRRGTGRRAVSDRPRHPGGGGG